MRLLLPGTTLSPAVPGDAAFDQPAAKAVNKPGKVFVVIAKESRCYSMLQRPAFKRIQPAITGKDRTVFLPDPAVGRGHVPAGTPLVRAVVAAKRNGRISGNDFTTG